MVKDSMRPARFTVLPTAPYFVRFSEPTFPTITSPVEMPIPEGLKVSVDQNTSVSIEGADKQMVGQFAADVRSLRPPEPYKGKGVRYADEHIRRKVGKAGA